MRKTIRSIIIAIFLSAILISCNNEVNGIVIGEDLHVHQSFSESRKLKKLIRQTLLYKDTNALSELSNFWCGGAAGCYDLGFIITQIIYKIGEDEFIEMVKKTNSEDFSYLQSLIRVGLEYGDNDKDGKMDNKKIETEFPNLNLVLSAK